MKRLIALVAAVCVLGWGPAGAGAPQVPSKLLLEDPAGDANYVNDQSLNSEYFGIPEARDNVTPADLSEAGDVLGGWITHDRKTVTFHVLTEAALPASEPMHVRIEAVNASSIQSACIVLYISLPGTNVPTYQGEHLMMRESCYGQDETRHTFKVSTVALPDGRGILRAKVARSTSLAFSAGQSITDFRVATRNVTGMDDRRLSVPEIDNTLSAADYPLD